MVVKVWNLLQCKIVAACRVEVYWNVFHSVHSCPRKVLEKSLKRSLNSKVTEEGVSWFSLKRT